MSKFYAATAIAVVLSACGPEPAVQPPPPPPAPDDGPMMHGDYPEVTVGSAGPAVADTASEVAEPVEEAEWFVILPDGRNCAPIRLLFSVDTPAELVSASASSGRPLNVVADNGELVLVRQGDGLGSKFIAFALGEGTCILAARMTASESQP